MPVVQHYKMLFQPSIIKNYQKSKQQHKKTRLEGESTHPTTAAQNEKEKTFTGTKESTILTFLTREQHSDHTYNVMSIESYLLLRSTQYDWMLTTY